MKRTLRVRLVRAAVLAGSGECAGCGGTFDDFNGGYCNVCQATGRG